MWVGKCPRGHRIHAHDVFERQNDKKTHEMIKLFLFYVLTIFWVLDAWHQEVTIKWCDEPHVFCNMTDFI
jgi:hypothetical protein